LPMLPHVTVTDADAYGQYASRATKAIADHGGVFLARAGRAVQLEGQGHPRNVVARFPSVEAAVDCYNSPAYQEALSFAKDAATRELVVVEEID